MICKLDGFIPINQLMKKENLVHFVVENYQRGYRWQTEHVNALLDDINNQNDKGKYCLQPIVVKKKDNSNGRTFELIDGQQRMTTLYLILCYLDAQDECYTIEYNTRDESAQFLKNINQYISSDKKTVIWKDFIDKFPKQNNADIYHFIKAYQAIDEWFCMQKGLEKNKFKNKIQEKVYVIFYPILSSSEDKNEHKNDAIKPFLNLNRGKIALTASELIKSLFILAFKTMSDKLVNEREMLAYQLSLEWDQIEQSLQNNELWHFICPTPKNYEKGTRIDFIFDLIQKRENGSADDTYRAYEKALLPFADETGKTEKSSPLHLWDEVKKYFYTINEWYCNKEIYHYLGYLNIVKYKNSNINKLIRDYHRPSRSKKDFLNQLKKDINDHCCGTILKQKDDNQSNDNNCELEGLAYGEDNKNIIHLLLLMNITYYLDKSSNRFPFDLYATEKWEIEHIVPRNPPNPSKELIGNIYSMIKDVIKNETKNEPMNWSSEEKNLELYKLTSIEDFHSAKEAINHYDLETLKKVYDQFITKFDAMHQLSNLALLDASTNSEIGNQPFFAKRQAIINADQASNHYILPATLALFGKQFTTQVESLGKDFWTLDDRKSYLSAIKRRLAPFLSSTNQLNKTKEMK